MRRINNQRTEVQEWTSGKKLNLVSIATFKRDKFAIHKETDKSLSQIRKEYMDEHI